MLRAIMHVRRRRVAHTLPLLLAAIFQWETPAAAREEELFALDLHAKLHFTADAAIASATYVVAAAHLPARGHALLLAGGAAMAAGFGKELLDLHTEGRFGWREIAWDTFGAAAGLGLAWGLDLLLRGVNEKHPLFFAPREGADLAALVRF